MGTNFLPKKSNFDENLALKYFCVFCNSNKGLEIKILEFIETMDLIGFYFVFRNGIRFYNILFGPLL